MLIGGFARNSLIDFPGTIACVVFTQGCNFNCPYCHNPDLVAGPVKGPGLLFDEEKILEFLMKRKGLLQGVVITGGEPTLQQDLIAFCKKIKAMGYRIKVDTNGTRPNVLTSLFDENLIDYVAMDIKTGLEDYGRVWPNASDTGRIAKSVNLIKERAPDYEFRTTCVKPFVTEETIHQIGRLINGAKRYILQPCSKNVDVLDPGFFEQENRCCSASDIQALRTTASGYVKTAAIR